MPLRNYLLTVICGCVGLCHFLLFIVADLHRESNKKDGYHQLNVRQLGSLRPWDHRGKCYMDRKRIQCLLNASWHVPVYLQPFSRNSSRKIQITQFYTFFAHFGLPWVRPWDYLGMCHMDRKRIQCWSNASQHVPIYLQPFLRYSEISVASDWF